MTVTQFSADNDLAIQAQLLDMVPGQTAEFGRVIAVSALVGWDVAGLGAAAVTAAA